MQGVHPYNRCLNVLRPTEQMDSLKTTLLRLKDNAVKKEMNQWTDFKNDRWQTTIKWVGEDIAKQWFDEICK